MGSITNPGGVSYSQLKTFTRVGNAVSGDVSYTGVGFKSKFIFFLANAQWGELPWSIGFCDAQLGEMCLYEASLAGTRTSAVDTAKCIVESDLVANAQNATLKTLDVDGFTLTWTKTGNPNPVDITVIALCVK